MYIHILKDFNVDLFSQYDLELLSYQFLWFWVYSHVDLSIES